MTYWRRGWDSNPVSSFRICNLQIPCCQDCRECQRCRRTLPIIAHADEVQHPDLSELRTTVGPAQLRARFSCYRTTRVPVGWKCKCTRACRGPFTYPRNAPAE